MKLVILLAAFGLLSARNSLPAAEQYHFSTLAGGTGGPGYADGAGASARFNGPSGLATDDTGNIYVADRENHVIRKITSAGVVTTVAGLGKTPGSADLIGRAARFNGPAGIAIDGGGTVYITDSYNHTIRKVAPDGTVSTLAGLAGSPGSVDGVGAAARFNRPGALAVDPAGTLYVADTGNHTIRIITPAGEVRTLAGMAGTRGGEYADGIGSAARFAEPRGVAIDRTGNVFVADGFNVAIRKITPAGVVSTFAGGARGSAADGTGTSARFGNPADVAIDSGGNLYVPDAGFTHTIRKITPDGVVTTIAGRANVSGSEDGASATFNQPAAVAVDQAGNVYVADYWNHTIRKITPAGIVSTLASVANRGGNEDGPLNVAQFKGPSGVARDSAGVLYVADGGNYTIRAITPEGEVRTIAGLAGVPGEADGTGNTARFRSPGHMAVDRANNVYVVDGNRIRKIEPGGVVSPVAAPANAFLTGLAVDSAGNIYVGDGWNNVIRRIDVLGHESIFAGTGSRGSADGPATIASFEAPGGLALDGAGNLYVADVYNYTIRKITPDRVVSTLAGLPRSEGSVDGIGRAARLSFPGSVAVDAAGNVYVAERTTIRKITPAGAVTTLGPVGSTTVGSDDGTGSTAGFYIPRAIAVTAAGQIYLADSENNKIRVGTPLTTVAPLVSSVSATPFHFDVAGATNQLVLLEAASELSPTNWTVLQRLTLGTGRATMVDEHAPGFPRRFYRIRSP